MKTTLHDIEFEIKNIPALDENFIPAQKFNEAFLAGATKPLAIAVERNGGYTYVCDTLIREGEAYEAANKFYVERIVKSILWCVGGFRITICGDDAMAAHIKSTYSPSGKRAFDHKTMGKVYENAFEVLGVPYSEKPAESKSARPIGRNLDGCRIGFDAGGSDRKVSAVIDGKDIYSEEVVWHPKTEADPAYHFGEIANAFKTAAKKMPRVDAIGVSSAGIYIENQTKIASLFIKVPEDEFDRQIKDIYIRAAKEIGSDIPIEVCNDGDVTALAGAMSLGDTNILGIAMGTSQAGGYVDKSGNVTGWLNELAFVPCDFSPEGSLDEWSGDIGCGAKYFSQDAVIKLAPKLGITFDDKLSPGEKLKIVQEKTDASGNYTSGVEKIYETIGAYLGHALAYYSNFYDMKHVLLMGRVTSGKGGDIIVEKAKFVLKDEYPGISGKINLQLPDEKSRRIGQSIAAASLPKIKQ